MQKQAQKRSLLNKLREVTDIGGQAAEKAPFLNQPGFKEVMDALRYTDDNVRSYATGEEIGDAAAPHDSTPLKALISSAETNINRREYMKAVADLSRFHEKMLSIAKILKNFDSDVAKIHRKFLLEDLDPETQEQLRALKSRWASPTYGLVKEAGFMDFFINLTTQRGRALAAWEKRYPKEVGEIKRNVITVFKESQKIFKSLLSSLKDMASARATRNVDAYDKHAKKIVAQYNAYDTKFKLFYESIKTFLDHLPAKEVQEVAQTAPAVPAAPIPAPASSNKDLNLPSPRPENWGSIPINMSDKDIIEEPQPPMISISPAAKSIAPPPPTTKVKSSPFAITPDREEPPTTQKPQGFESVRDTEKSGPPTEEESKKSLPVGSVPKADKTLITGYASHKKFVESLESLSSESPLIIKNYIIRYAKMIESQDPLAAVALFKIARSIEE